MTILVFLVDTSLSMGQRSYQGCSYVDVAKTIIDSILKLRSRDLQARSGDRYMLITTEDYPKCVKTGWREGNAVFSEQLKSLKPKGSGSIVQGVINSLRFLNINRSQSGIDNFGCGRFPCYIEPAVIITITDIQGANAFKEYPVVLPSKVNGNDLNDGPFRWDQRMHMIVLRLPGHPPFNPELKLSPHDETIEKLCASTGGKSYGVSNYKTIPLVVENLVQSIQITGVYVKLEVPTSLNRARAKESRATPMSDEMRERIRQRGLVHLFARNKPTIGHWPIPEAFSPETVMGSLPPRKPHPTLSVLLEPCEPLVPADFPFDKYELENSPLSEWILEQKRNNICFMVFMRGSDGERHDGWGKPFGYLRAATNFSSVNLFLMPYDYPVIFDLLAQFNNKSLNAVRNSVWRQRLEGYLDSIPPYYLSSLKKAFIRIQLPAPQLDDNSNFQFYPSAVHNYLGQMRSRSRMEMEQVCAQIAETTTPAALKIVIPPDSFVALNKVPEVTRTEHFYQRKRPVEDCRKMLPTVSTKRPRSTTPDEEEAQQRELMTIHVEGNSKKWKPTEFYKNPFAIKREDLMKNLHIMTENLEMYLNPAPVPVLDGGLPGTSLKLSTSDELHSQPIERMGLYQEYVKALENVGLAPMREIEPTQVRTHAFGNPFKIDKKAMAIDEVGEGPIAPAQKESKASRKDMASRPPRRKPGPLSRNSFTEFRQRLKSRSEASSSVVSDISYTSEDLSEELKEVSEDADVEMVNGDAEMVEPIENGMENLFSEVLEEKNSSKDVETTKIDHTYSPLPPSALPAGLEEEAEDDEEKPTNQGAAELWGLDEEADDDEDVKVIKEVPPSKPKPPSPEETKKNNSSSTRVLNGGTRGNGHIDPKRKISPASIVERDEFIFKLKQEAGRLLRRNNSRTVSQELQNEVFSLVDGSKEDLVDLLKFSAREAVRFRRFSLAAELENRASSEESHT